MKKAGKSILSVVLATSLVMSCLSSLKAKADDTETGYRSVKNPFLYYLDDAYNMNSIPFYNWNTDNNTVQVPDNDTYSVAAPGGMAPLVAMFGASSRIVATSQSAQDKSTKNETMLTVAFPSISTAAEAYIGTDRGKLIGSSDGDMGIGDIISSGAKVVLDKPEETSDGEWMYPGNMDTLGGNDITDISAGYMADETGFKLAVKFIGEALYKDHSANSTVEKKINTFDSYYDQYVAHAKSLVAASGTGTKHVLYVLTTNSSIGTVRTAYSTGYGPSSGAKEYDGALITNYLTKDFGDINIADQVAKLSTQGVTQSEDGKEILTASCVNNIFSNAITANGGTLTTRPDAIVFANQADEVTFRSLLSTTNQAIFDQLKSNGYVSATPIGMFSAVFASPDTALAPTWLAYAVHYGIGKTPSSSTAIQNAYSDMETMTSNFYTAVYGYTPSAAQLGTMYQPVYNVSVTDTSTTSTSTSAAAAATAISTVKAQVSAASSASTMTYEDYYNEYDATAKNLVNQSGTSGKRVLYIDAVSGYLGSGIYTYSSINLSFNQESFGNVVASCINGFGDKNVADQIKSQAGVKSLSNGAEYIDSSHVDNIFSNYTPDAIVFRCQRDESTFRSCLCTASQCIFDNLACDGYISASPLDYTVSISASEAFENSNTDFPLVPTWLAYVIHYGAGGYTTGTTPYYVAMENQASDFDTNYYKYIPSSDELSLFYESVYNESADGGSYQHYFSKEYSDPPTNPSTSKVADPVDSGTGAHKISLTPISITGAQKLSFTLQYDSSELSTGQMGTGWYNNYEMHIVKQSNGSLFYYITPSEHLTFTLDADSGLYTCASLGKQNWTITQNSDGAYLLKCGNDESDSFNSNGRLTDIQNHTGLSLAITYPTYDQEVVTEPVSGQTLTVQYTDDTEQFVSSVTARDGSKATFQYTGNTLTSVTDADGKTMQYTYDDDGRVLTGTDGDGKLYFTDTYDSMGRIATQDDGVSGNGLTKLSYDTTSVSGETIVTITDRNGHASTNTFDSIGQEISTTDQNGNATSYTYDSNGNIATETDGNGNATAKTYDSDNNLLSSTDATGSKTTYTYDSNGNQLTKTDAAGNATVNTYDSNNRLTGTTDARGTKTTYSYNINGLVSEKDVGSERSIYYYNQNGELQAYIDPNENVFYHTYDAAGNLKTSSNEFDQTTTTVYDANGNLLSKTDADGNKITYTYDSRGDVLTQTNAKGNVTTYAYNANGKVTSMTDAKGGVTAYTYDGEDRVTQVKDAQGNVTKTAYDAAGQILSKTDAKGNTTKYTYDKAGNVLTTTAPGGGVMTNTYYTNNTLKTQTDAAGNTTAYAYDAAGRLTKKTNAAGKATTYTYDADGNLLTTADALGDTTTNAYDIYGNLLSVTDPNGNKTQYTYDADNRRISQTDALGNKMQYAYDLNGKLLSATDANSNTTTYSYDNAGRLTGTTDALGHTKSIAYDGNGNETTTTDANGHSTAYTYDATNLQTSSTDALGDKTQYTFDSLGRLSKTTDARGNSVTYTYDSNGQIISATDALSGQSSETYDADGNVTGVTNPLGGTTGYTYDTSDRLTSESTVSGGTIQYGYNSQNLLASLTNARSQKATYTYDDAGRLSSITRPEGTTAYTYDKNGNILTVKDAAGTIARTFDALNRVKTYTDVNGNVIQYSYDAVGNLAALTYPDGRVVHYTYDAVNRMKTVTDWSNRVTSYTYDAAGNVTQTSRPDGSVLTETYDAANRVTNMVDKTASGTIINQYAYTYDADGNILTETSSDGSTTATMTYDANGRLTDRQVKNASSVVATHDTFGLDAAGNITNASGTGMVYDKNDRLTSYNGTAVAYDADGNMTGGPLGTFSYDSQNRLTAAGSITYTYDAENNRVAMATGSSTTKYVYDTTASLSRILMSTDASGNKTYYVYGNGLLGAQDASGNYSVYHYDYRGSTTAITNSSGSVTDRYTYGTYGDLTGHTGSSNTVFLFNGRDGVQTDSNGLYYMRARYYSPTLLRFVNADTLTGSIQNSETLNRFAYANGNPISFIDPFGRSSEPGNINYKGKNTQAGFSAGFDYFNYILAHRGTSFLYSGIYANWNGAPYQIGFYGGEIGALFMSVAGGIFGGEGIGAEGAVDASDVAEEAGGASKPLYRVMGEGEFNAVKETGMLRGGREGTTYFTDSYFRNANVAQARLALPEKPEYIMEFEIANNPSISGGTKVLPNYGQIGGGREYFTDDSVYVNINNYQKMIP